MAYTINKTDGTPIVVVADGQIDQSTTDLTLVGKNYSGFGEFLNENFVKILENFASQSQPGNPLEGQLWYDTSEARIKVYSGTEWKSIGTAVLSETRPLEVGVGDFWFNSVDKQLYFYDGVRDYLLGPDFSFNQGISGIRVEQLEDNSRRFRTVTALYTAGALSGFFSPVEFIIRNRPAGYNADITNPNPVIRIGFNPANPADFKYRGISDDADRLGTYLAAEYPRKGIANTFTQPITVQNSAGISWGPGPQGNLSVEGSGDVIISNISDNRQIVFRTTRNNLSGNSLVIRPGTLLTSEPDEFNIYPSNLNSITTVGGSLTVKGNLTVEGDSVFVAAETIRLLDKTIELGVPESGSATDTTANGGGLILTGTTNHSILWNQSTGDWDFTENIDIPALKGYKINGVEVLRDTGSGIELTSAVSAAPGLTSFGAQISITADNITINNNRISNNARNTNYVDGGSANPANIVIEPLGDVILAGATKPKIVGVQTTSEDSISQTVEAGNILTSTELSEATSKKYVTGLVRTRNIPLTLDITGDDPLTDAPLTESEISAIIESIAPPTEYDLGTEARISTMRYYLPDQLPVQINLLTTTADGYIQTVAAQEFPRRAFARPLVRRGRRIFTLQASGAPSGKSWVQTFTEEDASPVSTNSALFGTYI
jgi:hypothetical protein